MIDTSSRGWVRVDYMSARAKPGDAGNATTLAPIVLINVRNPGAISDSEQVVQARGVMDTGANVSAVPMWAARHRAGQGIQAGGVRRIRHVRGLPREDQRRSKCGACFDEAEKAVWLRRAGGDLPAAANR